MEWISVGDELPKVFVSVMVFPYPDFTYSDKITAELQYDGRWYVDCEDSHSTYEEKLDTVTHWMPLPAPPTQQ